MNLRVVSVCVTYPTRDPVVKFIFNDGHELEILAFKPIAEDQGNMIRLTDVKGNVECIYYLEDYREATNTLNHLVKSMPLTKFAHYWQMAIDFTKTLSRPTDRVPAAKLKALLESTKPYLIFLRENYL